MNKDNKIKFRLYYGCAKTVTLIFCQLFSAIFTEINVPKTSKQPL